LFYSFQRVVLRGVDTGYYKGILIQNLVRSVNLATRQWS